jgi:hypothetical protein
MLDSFTCYAHADEERDDRMPMEEDTWPRGWDRVGTDHDDPDPDEAYERHLETRDDWEAWRDDNREREIMAANGR